MRALTIRGYLALALLLAVIVGALVMASGVQAQQTTSVQESERPVTHHAIGTFQVAVTPADPEVVEAGLGLSRYSLAKTFSGDLTGTSVGQMLAGGPSPGVGGADTGSYVAMERIVGNLDGREGAFLMAHRGDMGPQGYSLSITVVPNSGTGALAGLEGELDLTITDGVHHYDLAYSLPSA